MGIYATDLRTLVIRPTLEQLNQWSPAAENLLMGTAAQESQLGFRLASNQLKGIYRISETTHQQVWDEFLIHDPETASRLRGLASQQQFLQAPHNELAINLSYATGVAWMIYLRHGLSLPDAHNIRELGKCWLNYYADRDGKKFGKLSTSEAELEKFIAHYRRLVLRENKKLAA